MIISSGGSQHGTNFYHHFSEAEITIDTRKDGGKKYIYYAAGGNVIGFDTWEGRKKTGEIRYGEYRKLRDKKTGKWEHEKIRSNTICTIVPRYHVLKTPLTLYGKAGVLVQKYYGGSLRGEEFRYIGKVKNRVAYHVNRGTKAQKAGFSVLSPNGELYAKYTGKISFSGRYNNSGLFTKNSWGEDKKTELDLCLIDNLFDDRNYEVEVYNKSFKLILAGKVINGQKADKWTQAGGVVYYVQGVAISEKLYNATPEQLDAKEILNIENAQVRAAFIKKITLERIIQTCGGQMVHQDADRGYDLISIPLKPVQVNRWDREPDKVMKILKVKCPSTGAFYCLRVPPTMETCEQARQWTFGVAEPSVANTKAEYIEFGNET